MSLKRIAVLAAMFGALSGARGSTADADSWAAPRVREVFSDSREYFVRILPGESLGDTSGFRGQKKGKYSTAEFYRRAHDRSYRLVAETTLLNPVAPVEVLVANSGALITIDNWHNAGYGKIVTLYTPAGKLARAYELQDLFEREEIERFPHSVSSIHWRNGPLYVRDDQKTALITVKSGADFLFGLESGQFKYCEPHAGTYRCRSSNRPRQWMPGNKVPHPR
jgi:hypothetical protein